MRAIDRGDSGGGAVLERRERGRRGYLRADRPLHRGGVGISFHKTTRERRTPDGGAAPSRAARHAAGQARALFAH